MIRIFLIFLFILVLAFAQSVFHFNFLLGLVLILGLALPQKRALVFAFLAGLFLDLIVARAVGYSSLGYLVPVFFLILYRQRFSYKNAVWLGLIAIGSYFWSAWLAKTPVNLIECLVLAGLIGVSRFFLPQHEQLSLKI